MTLSYTSCVMLNLGFGPFQFVSWFEKKKNQEELMIVASSPNVDHIFPWS